MTPKQRAEEAWQRIRIGDDDPIHAIERAMLAQQAEHEAELAYIRQEYEKWSFAQKQAHNTEVDGYQASRNYAIELLAKALGVDANKQCAIEYYAQRISEHCAAKSKNLQELRIALAELQDQRDAAVAEALERAAKVCDEYARRDHANAVTVCDLAATAIRALKPDAGGKDKA